MKSFKHLSPRKVRKFIKSLVSAISFYKKQRENILAFSDLQARLIVKKNEYIKKLLLYVKILAFLYIIPLICGILGLYFSYFA